MRIFARQDHENRILFIYGNKQIILKFPDAIFAYCLGSNIKFNQNYSKKSIK